MGVEIERKFLVADDAWHGLADAGTRMRQGYLCTAKERTVRVRVAGPTAWLTIKGEAQGARRAEYEYPIPPADAEDLLRLCEPTLIEKTRYRLEHAGHVWEVDVFAGANAPLVVAEVELRAVDEAVALPAWLGAEVTGDRRYQNSQLSRHPFSHW
ncbi:MAG: CYTH domain-containing protein [Candidatus Krumholzibacteriia bacterium]